MTQEQGRRSVAVLRLLDIGKRDTGQDLKDIAQRPVFILSTGRTGTQFLAHHFDRDPRVCALHEPVPSRGLRFWTVAYLEGAVDQGSMSRTLRVYRTGFFDKISEPIYIESNNFLAGFAETLIDEFDEPTLIHVVRDPRSYVRSAINKGAAKGLKGLTNRYVPFSHLGLESDSENPTVQRTARYWTLVNSHLRTTGQDYAGYHLYRYEDLFQGDSAAFKELADLIGIRDPAINRFMEGGRINESPRELMPPWDQWAHSEQEIVIEECGELMAHFGYQA